MLIAEKLDQQQLNEFEKINNQAREENQWSDPIPFDDNSLLPEFPVNVLPGIGQTYVSELAEVTQVDPALPACLYLAALSTCYGGRVTVDLKSHQENCNQYIACELPSGERKSPILDHIARPVYQYQRQKQDELQDKIREALNHRKVLEARLTKLQKKAANTNEVIDRNNLIKEAAAVAEEIDKNPIPVSPVYIVDDITTEKLGVLMAENKETMAIMSAEGGIFKLMNGLYSERDGNFDLYLKAHSGDSFACHRLGRDSITMDNPRLTIGLAIQPDVLDEIGRNQHFRGRGLPARFLFSICATQAGFRQRQFKTLSTSLIEQYRDHIFFLMNIPATTLSLSQDACDVWDQFYNDIEHDLRPGEPLESLRDWGSKLPGAVARIAGLLHIAKHGTAAVNKPISVDIVTGSCVLGIYFRDHAIAAFSQMGEDTRIKAAKKILSYLKRIKPIEFKGRDVLHHAHFINRTMEDVIPGINILVERNYIRKVSSEYTGKGRPAADSYEVNPKIYEN
jgi:hypothetical protein